MVESSSNPLFEFNPKEADAQRQVPQQSFKEQEEKENHDCNHTSRNSKFKFSNCVVNISHEHENAMGNFACRTSGQEKSEESIQNYCQQEKVNDEKGNINTNLEKECNSQ